MSAKFTVWSYDERNHQWLAVATRVSQRVATEALEGKRRAAAKVGWNPNGFVMLPSGERPDAPPEPAAPAEPEPEYGRGFYRLRGAIDRHTTPGVLVYLERYSGAGAAFSLPDGSQVQCTAREFHVAGPERLDRP